MRFSQKLTRPVCTLRDPVAQDQNGQVIGGRPVRLSE